MSGVLFPIAPNPEAALNTPVGRAGLESAARAAAGGAPVIFARELAGPAFETRQMAADAYRGKLDEPGATVAPADRYCELQPVMAQGGRLRTVWRLCVAYWKVQGERDLGPLPQARAARRSTGSADADKATLDAMAEQPLRPLQPQKALDMGLFEVRLPENPAVIIADE